VLRWTAVGVALQELFFLDGSGPLNATVVVDSQWIQLSVEPSANNLQVAQAVCEVSRSGATPACVEDANAQLLRRRRPRMMYRIWVNEKVVLPTASHRRCCAVSQPAPPW
jgi:hypothetical protein